MSKDFLAGVELGGTKSIAVLARGGSIVDRFTTPTTLPEETLGRLRAQLDRWQAQRGFAALGIASFGPVRLSLAHHDHAHLLATPKPGWTGAPIGPALAEGLGVPWRIDTDVNGAALAEYRAADDVGSGPICYVTLGTGVGVGMVVDGRAIHGLLHPEAGHLRLRRARGDAFAGHCRFHGDCIEGLVSGPALAARFGCDPALVPDDHPTWNAVASDVGELIAALLLMAAPVRVFFGGGIATARPRLLDKARTELLAAWSSYLPYLSAASVGRIVVPATLGTEAGPLGALALAKDAACERNVT